MKKIIVMIVFTIMLLSSCGNDKSIENKKTIDENLNNKSAVVETVELGNAVFPPEEEINELP